MPWDSVLSGRSESLPEGWRAVKTEKLEDAVVDAFVVWRTH